MPFVEWILDTINNIVSKGIPRIERTGIENGYRKPGYWDGPYEILVRDPDLAPYYDVVGGIISTEGTKVRIRRMSLKTALFDEEVGGGFFPVCVKTTYANPESNQRFYAQIDKWREEVAGHREKFGRE